MNNTIVILTALPLEYEAVVAYLPQRRKEIKSDNTIYEMGDYVTPKAPWQVVVGKLTAQGNYQAARETEWAITHFNPTYMFFVGVAGGLKDVQLGDVVAASFVRGYESGKTEEDKWKSRAQVEHSSYALLQLAQNLAGESQWLKKLFTPAQPAPKARVCPIASGEKVVASRAFLAQLQETCSDAVAVEMEALGFLGTFRAKPQVQGIVIRGISDLVVDKSQSDAKGWQPIAACHAAAFAFAMLDKLAFPVVPITQISTSSQPAQKWLPWLISSAMWCLLTVFLGLSQAWFVLAIHYFGMPLPSKKLFMDGALLFFSTTVVSSLAFDYYYYLPKKDVLPQDNAFKRFLFKRLPALVAFVVLVVSLILFTGYYTSIGHEMNINQQAAVSALEQGIISITLIYAFIIKFVTFKLKCGEHN
jgi:nucleoside phosphorylase